MELKNIETTVLSNVLKRYKNTNKYSNYRISKTTGLSEKTIKKIIENTASIIRKKTIEKLLLLDFEEDEKKKIRKILSDRKKNEKKKARNLKKSAKEKEHNHFIEEFEKILSENKKLKIKIDILENKSFNSDDYLQKRKEGAFSTDIETRTFLISKLWDFNDTIFEKWSDLKLLLDINGKEKNIKLKKGISSVLETLKSICEYLEYITFSTEDDKENIIILEEN